MIGIMLRVLVSVAGLALVVWRVGVDMIIEHLSKVHAGGFLAAVVAAVALAIPHALRWREVIRCGGHEVSPWWALRGMLIGQFFNQVLPSSIGGDAVKAWLVVRRGIDLGAAIRSVLLDRLSGAAANVVVSLAVLSILFVTVGPNRMLHIAVAIVAATAVGFAVIVGVDWSPLRRVIAGRQADAGWSRPFWSVLDEALALGPQARHVLVRPAVHLYSLAFMVGMVGLMVFEAHLIGADIDLGRAMLVVPPALMFAAFPLSFAGWGVREGAMIVMLGIIGVTADVALAISLLLGLTLAAAASTGGLCLLFGGLGAAPSTATEHASRQTDGRPEFREHSPSRT